MMLGLQHNNMTNISAIALGKALRGNNVFKTLFMCGNYQLTEEGISECVLEMRWTEAKQVILDLPYTSPV